MKQLLSALPTLLAYLLPIGLIALIWLFMQRGFSPLQNGFIGNIFQNIIVPQPTFVTTRPCLDPQNGEIAFESYADGNWDIFW
jgi:hypothetical protein